MSRYVRHNFFPMGPRPEPQILEGILSNEENSRKPEKGFCFRITAACPKQNTTCVTSEFEICFEFILMIFVKRVEK